MTELDLGILNNKQPTELYKKIPCTVGYSYIRIEVDGTVRACCVARHAIGKLDSMSSWRKIWRSVAYQAFREKMSRINRDHFHVHDPEFLFCQQCSHVPLNRLNHEISMFNGIQNKSPIEPVNTPAIEQINTPAIEQINTPAMEPVVASAEKPAERLTEKPTEKPTAKPATKRIAKVAKVAKKLATKPATKPVEKPAKKLIAKPMQKRIANPAPKILTRSDVMEAIMILHEHAEKQKAAKAKARKITKSKRSK